MENNERIYDSKHGGFMQFKERQGGDRRQTGDRRQAPGDRRQAQGDRRQAPGDRRQAPGDRRQASGQDRRGNSSMRQGADPLQATCLVRSPSLSPSPRWIELLGRFQSHSACGVVKKQR